MTVAEIRAAVRQKGFARLEVVAAVVLETDESLSVVNQAGESDSAFADVDPSPRALTASQERGPQRRAAPTVRDQ